MAVCVKPAGILTPRQNIPVSIYIALLISRCVYGVLQRGSIGGLWRTFLRGERFRLVCSKLVVTFCLSQHYRLEFVL
jgi:hypothetical protein